MSILILVLDAQSFREMAKEAVGADSNLQIDLVVKLASFDDINEALYFARLYNIHKKYWPFALKNIDDETFNRKPTC